MSEGVGVEEGFRCHSSLTNINNNNNNKHEIYIDIKNIYRTIKNNKTVCI